MLTAQGMSSPDHLRASVQTAFLRGKPAKANLCMASLCGLGQLVWRDSTDLEKTVSGVYVCRERTAKAVSSQQYTLFLWHESETG